MTPFPLTYAAARARFRAAAHAAGARTGAVELPGRRGAEGEALSIDWATVEPRGPRSGDGTLVLICGTHGPEGPAGSAILCGILDAVAARPRGFPRLLVVHGLNPWGFSWVSRADEANIDLNRNMIPEGQPRPRNSAYDRIVPVFEVADWQEDTADILLAALDAHAAQHGARAVTNALLSGQYHAADGLNYGGDAPAWATQELVALLLRETHPGERVQVLDLHTGVAGRGALALLAFQVATPPDPAQAALLRCMARRPGNAIGAEGLADHSGLIVTGIGAALPDRRVSGAVVELGTAPRRQIRAALLLDLWLRRHAPPSPLHELRCDAAAAVLLRRGLLTVFSPLDDPEWRDVLVAQTRGMADAIMAWPRA